VARYSEAAAAAEEAAFQMSQPGGMVTSDGKVSPWVSIHQSMTKWGFPEGENYSTLATKLRQTDLTRNEFLGRRRGRIFEGLHKNDHPPAVLFSG
jgi:hypothetical protein